MGATLRALAALRFLTALRPLAAREEGAAAMASTCNRQSYPPGKLSQRLMPWRMPMLMAAMMLKLRSPHSNSRVMKSWWAERVRETHRSVLTSWSRGEGHQPCPRHRGGEGFRVSVCVRACIRAFVRACVRMCVHTILLPVLRGPLVGTAASWQGLPGSPLCPQTATCCCPSLAWHGMAWHGMVWYGAAHSG